MSIKKKQKRVNKQFEKEGLTDDILDKQVAINTKRHDLNIRECKDGEYKQ